MLIVANANSPASPQCVINCINKLLEIQQGQIILVLDEQTNRTAHVVCRKIEDTEQPMLSILRK